MSGTLHVRGGFADPSIQDMISPACEPGSPRQRPNCSAKLQPSSGHALSVLRRSKRPAFGPPSLPRSNAVKHEPPQDAR